MDTVKTRMQSIEAKTEYKNSFHCAARVVREEGFLTLWSGAVPRLGRLILSGGIVFTMYVFHCLYNTILLTVSSGTKRPWTCSTGSIQTRNIYKPNYAPACMLLPHFVKPCTCTCRGLKVLAANENHHTTVVSLLLAVRRITVVTVWPRLTVLVVTQLFR